jgi:hypothetical protein
LTEAQTLSRLSAALEAMKVSKAAYDYAWRMHFGGETKPNIGWTRIIVTGELEKHGWLADDRLTDKAAQILDALGYDHKD